MAKRILVTSTDLMMVQFLVPHVINLSMNGYEVEIACSNVGNRINEIKEKLKGYVKKIHIVRLRRSPVAPINFVGYCDMKKVIKSGKYDLIWTNEPVMGIVTRLASQGVRKSGTKVMYMTHGFHFYTGAPKKNWIIFYSIEQWASRLCDIIVTVNREDYQRAKKMHAKSVKYIHGIGINPDRLSKDQTATNIRQELNLNPDDFLVISVGELNENKNHQVIIKAVGKLKDPQIHYIICGKGDQLEKLKDLANELGILDNVHFLGYRMDVLDICKQADLFVFPSHREGLPIAPLEAMFCGLPLVTSNIRGPVDFMKEGKTGYLCSPDDVNAFAKNIKNLKMNPQLRIQMGKNCKKAVQPFLIENSKAEVLSLIKSIIA